ncbi:MAG: hypothetical protein AAB363_06395 [Planctomycetota bacterium]
MLLVVAASAPALGAIVRTQARVETTVQELIDGAPGSVNADDGEFTADGVDLPLSVSVTLTSTDLDGALVSLGQGFSEFADPARLDLPNPQEFALEVACYSNAESISYSVTSIASEARTVLFTRRGSSAAPPEISFVGGSTRQVESRVFLSGAVVLWSTNAETNLDELRLELAVTITRDDDVTPLFETTLTVDGDDINPSATGPIRFELVDLSELETLGLDEATLTVLQQVEAVDTLLVVVIPPQEHAYRYVVSADEELTLNAGLEVRVRNAPGGTGVAAVLGRPFQDLADFIERGLPGVDGEVVQRSLNDATANRAISLVPSPDTTRAIPRLCGAGGAAMIGLIFLLGLMRATLCRSCRRLTM